MTFGYTPQVFVTPIKTEEDKKHELRVFLDVYQLDDIQRDIRAALNNLIGMKHSSAVVDNANHLVALVLEKYVDAGALRRSPDFTVSVDAENPGNIRIQMEDLNNCV